MSTHIRGTETNIGSVKDRFGGIDTPAALGGFLAILGVLALVGAIIGALGIAYQFGDMDMEGNLADLDIVGFVVAALVVLGGGFVGGWVAARMARFDGIMNGIGAALWLVVVVAVFALLGAFIDQEWNVTQSIGLPDWFSRMSADDVGAAAIIAGLVGMAVLFLGAALGGAVGNSYNQKVDAAINDGRTTTRTTGEEYPA